MHVRERGEGGKRGRGDFVKRCGMESGAAERSMLKSDSDARSYALIMLELVTSR
jgi:hypothetical protein